MMSKDIEGIILTVLVLAFSFWYTISTSRATFRRLKKIKKWASSKKLKFPHDVDFDMKTTFPYFHCLSQGIKQFSYNGIGGKWGNRNFLGFDYHYEIMTASSKGQPGTKQFEFSAVILSTDIPLEPLFIRPKIFSDKFKGYLGQESVQFESAEFNRKYYVESTDRKWAYDVIHQRTMEFLLANPGFIIEFSPFCVIAYQNCLLAPKGIEHAAKIIEGILDRIPDYVQVRQKEKLQALQKGS